MKNELEIKKLRRYIRDGIKITLDKRKKTYLAELSLRNMLRDLILEVSAEDLLILEASEKPESDPHPMTGINVLRELMANTNILKMLAQGYKSLTSNEQQRKSFRAHIINAIQNTLVTMDTTEGAEKSENLSEQITVDVEDDKLIDADDGQDEEEPDPKEEFTIDGEDETGRNRAFNVYPKIEQSVIDYYSILSQDEDKEVFLDYILTNLKMYFDKWEEQLQNNIKEPSTPGYEEAQGELGTPGAPAEEELGMEEMPQGL